MFDDGTLCNIRVLHYNRISHLRHVRQRYAYFYLSTLNKGYHIPTRACLAAPLASVPNSVRHHTCPLPGTFARTFSTLELLFN